MTLQAILFALVLVTTSALTTAAVLLIGGALARRGAARSGWTQGSNRTEPVFLLDGDRILDANDRGEDFLRLLCAAATPEGHAGPGGWQALLRHLVALFPDLPDTLAQIDPATRQRLDAVDGSGRALLIEGVGGGVRLTLSDASADDSAVIIDRLSHRALEEELSTLRAVTDNAPMLAWRENESGQVVWANGAYLRQLARSGIADQGRWPLPSLFGASGLTGRRETLSEGVQNWFDLQRHPDGAGSLCFAMPADDAHRAEKARREFVQMLTKTFATLPIGLAVFDRARRLQVFNPALGDLTGLETEFLLARPGIEGFFNRMREKRSLPEPRDYHGWTRRLLQIEAGSGTRDFEETWNLPGGQTYRVSVRPHPDGGLALLIEDVTAETHLSRNFRAELDTSQGVLDMLDQALAVFGADGQLILTNRAFDTLWDFESHATLAGVHISQALALWRGVAGETSVWDSIAAVAQRDGPAAMAGRISRRAGGSLRIQARRASNGTLMISFDGTEAPARPLTGISAAGYRVSA